MIGRLFRGFRRSPPPAIDLRPHMGPQPPHEKDWAVGDRAKCIAEGKWVDIDRVRYPGPRRGQLLRVAEVQADSVSVWLIFDGLRGFGFPAGHFRKLRPCSADFREQLRQRRPAKVPALKEPELVP